MRPFQSRQTRASKGPPARTKQKTVEAAVSAALAFSQAARLPPQSGCVSPAEQIGERQGGHENECDDAVASNVVPATDLGQVFCRGNP